MSGQLQYFVTLDNPKTGERVTFGPEDEVPGWAAKAITNPSAWAEVPSLDAGAGSNGDGDAEGGYKGWSKGQLTEELEKRNGARDDDEQIVVQGKGTIADLTAALVADDAALES